MTSALIMVVDDDACVRAFMGRLLSRAGYRVVAAADGAGGLSLFEKRRPDLVILDSYLPDIDGFEVCRRLRSRPGCQDIPILFCSGDSDLFSVSRSFEAGGTGYILKPFDNDVLLGGVTSALERVAPDAAESGYALVTVLVVTVALGLIAGTILRSRLQASSYASGSTGRVTQDLADQATLNEVQAAWALAGASCASGPGVSCSGSGCSCNCTLASGAQVAATPATIGSECQLAVVP